MDAKVERGKEKREGTEGEIHTEGLAKNVEDEIIIGYATLNAKCKVCKCGKLCYTFYIRRSNQSERPCLTAGFFCVHHIVQSVVLARRLKKYR